MCSGPHTRDMSEWMYERIEEMRGWRDEWRGVNKDKVMDEPSERMNKNAWLGVLTIIPSMSEWLNKLRCVNEEAGELTKDRGMKWAT